MDEVFEDFVEATAGDAYAGYRLVPSFATGNQDFDFIYLGVWENGSMMGRDLADYETKGDDVDEAWDEAADCPASLMYGSIRIEQNSGDGDGPITVTAILLDSNAPIHKRCRTICCFIPGFVYVIAFCFVVSQIAPHH